MLGRARLALDALDYPGALTSEAVLKSEQSQGPAAPYALAGLWARRGSAARWP